MKPAELIRWLNTLHPDSTVCIDEGGLTLHEVGADGKTTGAYLELGSLQEPEICLNCLHDRDQHGDDGGQCFHGSGNGNSCDCRKFIE